MVALTRTSRFADLVAMTEQVAAAEFGVNGREQKAVVSAWKAVGF
jgi:Zn-dependent metalloprotease